MAIFKGKNISIEIYGESHAPQIGVKVLGLKSFKFDNDKLLEFLNRRKASGQAFSTSRKEDDLPIFKGIENNTTNDNFSIEILNNNVKSGDYNELYGKPRPSHADYSSYLKDGTLDYRGGGRFSGRLTAPLCAIGGILKEYLESKGVFIRAYISQIGTIKGLSYKDKALSKEEVLTLSNNGFPSLSNKDEMLSLIASKKAEGDSVGGVIECIVYGLKGGVGDNLFEGLEGKISSLIYSVPAVKGVEFGLGFMLSESFGSIVNDELYYDKNGKISFKTNNSGGINGGISNGEPLTLRVAIKPTPSILKEQNTVDLVNKENVKITIKGRHDSCIVPRAVPCIESAVAIAIYDEIISEL